MRGHSDFEHHCIHDGKECPYAGTCMYNAEGGDGKMQVCEAAIGSGIARCTACRHKERCGESWSCFRRERWERKRAEREVRR